MGQKVPQKPLLNLKSELTVIASVRLNLVLLMRENMPFKKSLSICAVLTLIAGEWFFPVRFVNYQVLS